MFPISSTSHNKRPRGTVHVGAYISNVAAAALFSAALLYLVATTSSRAQSSSFKNYPYRFRGAGAFSKIQGSWLQGAAPAEKQQASIVVLVTTKASSSDRRTWLRQQFKKSVQLLRQKDAEAANGVVLKFAIGSQSLPNSSRDQLQGEEREHGDILMLDIIDVNMPDPPPRDSDETATSLKVVYGVKWAVEHYTFPWLVRLGDDAYFWVDHFLLNVASTLEKQKLVLSYRVTTGAGVKFSNGGSISEYPSGMGFIMTYDVAQFISNNAPHLHKGYPRCGGGNVASSNQHQGAA